MTPRAEGYAAGLTNKRDDDCPYEGDPDQHEWLEGWVAGMVAARQPETAARSIRDRAAQLREIHLQVVEPDAYPWEYYVFLAADLEANGL